MNVPPDQVWLVASGVLAVGVGVVSRARPPRFRARAGRTAVVLLASLACVAGGAVLIAADPATLATTPVAIAVALGAVEAILASISLSGGRTSGVVK
jgi:hypothetical protein